MRSLPKMNRKRWITISLIGAFFMLSPFIMPSMLTIILFFPGFPLATTGLIMALICKRHRFKRWEFREVTCITIKQDLTWEGINYIPNITDEKQLPEHARQYMNDYRYLIPMKGWIPLTKYDSFTTRMKRTLKNTFKSKKRGLLLFSYDHLDESKKMLPIDHIHSHKADYELITPELYEKECKSTLAANFTKSQDSGKLKMNWIIITIVILVVLGIILKVTGAI